MGEQHTTCARSKLEFRLPQTSVLSPIGRPVGLRGVAVRVIGRHAEAGVGTAGVAVALVLGLEGVRVGVRRAPGRSPRFPDPPAMP